MGSDMKSRRLEIIHLRSSTRAIEDLVEPIKGSIPAGEMKAAIVSIYRRRGLVTDVAIHIHHDDAAEEKAPCDLALHLASALRDFGLVEHTVWDEMHSISSRPIDNGGSK